MKTEPLLYSPHVFRVSTDHLPELMPMHAPKDRHFYLATRPSAADKQKRYFVAAPRDRKTKELRVMTCLNRTQAMKFANLRLAEGFAVFINNYAIFPDGAEFWIVLEPERYKAEATQAMCVAEAEATKVEGEVKTKVGKVIDFAKAEA